MYINEEVENLMTFSDILYICRKRFKLITITISIFIIFGILYGLFAPKVYISKSILSIGNIPSGQIQHYKELIRTLKLINFH